MKRAIFSIPLVALFAVPAFAQQENGRVISTTPVVQQVSVPQQVCTQQQVVSTAPSSGAGAIMGAIAGGAVGNAIGNGSGRAAATALGLFGGAVLGNRVEGPGQQYVQNVQQCGTQMTYENRTVGYNVTYEYAGRQYTVQMPYDPGQYVPIQVSPVASQGNSMQVQPMASAPITYAQPGVVVSNAAPVVYSPAYIAAPAPVYGYPPVGVSLNLGYSRGGGYGHHHGGRW